MTQTLGECDVNCYNDYNDHLFMLKQFHFLMKFPNSNDDYNYSIPEDGKIHTV